MKHARQNGLNVYHWDSTRIRPPIAVANEGSVAWAASADVVVIGLGAAGASAALEASEQDLKVILVDRFQGGGASELSGGIVYAGGGTKAQLDAGYRDTPDAMFEYLSKEVGGAVAPGTLHRFCEESVETLNWLERHGAHFGGPEAPRKTSYPSPREFLYYSDNSTAPAYAGTAPSAPRGHRTMKPGVFNKSESEQGEEGGFHLMSAMKGAIARARDVAIFRQAKAVRLIVNQQNAVLGVEIRQIHPDGAMSRLHKWCERFARNPVLRHLHVGLPFILLTLFAETFSRSLYVRGKRGTILTTGGFVRNRSLVAKIAPQYLGSPPLGTPGCDGSGLRLGISVGADTRCLESISAWRFLNPPYAWLRGIVVGPDGKRLVNEELYGAVLGRAIYEGAKGKAWLIVDDDIQQAAIAELKQGCMHPYQRHPVEASQRQAIRADTIENLARKTGLPASTLKDSLSAYNSAIGVSVPDAMGKSLDLCSQIARSPFYAIDLRSSLMNPLFSITLGGLAVDEKTGQVLRPGDVPIEGLYAAGRTAVGIPSRNYVSGLSLADCVWSGRRAAQALARKGE